jgi:hypothetical protein
MGGQRLFDGELPDTFGLQSRDCEVGNSVEE